MAVRSTMNPRGVSAMQQRAAQQRHDVAFLEATVAAQSQRLSQLERAVVQQRGAERGPLRGKMTPPSTATREAVYGNTATAWET